jgi:ATP-dependent helicase/nuclease subunit B
MMVTRIEDIFGIEAQKAAIDYTVSKAAALSAAAKAFGALGDGRIAPPGWKQAVSALIHSEQSNAELDKMRMFLSAPTQVPEITPQRDGVIISSVSQIEQYAGCPFSYMVQYSLQPAEDPGEDMTPAGEGAFLHEAMERLGIKLSEYDMDAMDESQIQEIMQREAEIIAENFDFQRLSRDNKGKYQASQLIKTARHGAVIYSKHMKNSKFTPLGQEIEFGEGKPLGPIEFTLKSGTEVKISGKVDRLDTYFCANGEYARIVDYKSSVKKVDYPKIESGRQLQLFIYMDAYLSRNPNIKASGVFYFPLRKDYIDEEKGAKRNDKMQGLFVDIPENVDALDHDIIELGASELIKAKIKKDGGFDKNSDNITAEGFYKVMDYAKGKAKETLDAMDAGEIPVRPVTHGNTSQCTYCDFASICKKDINMHEERPELSSDAAKDIILGGNDG